jgi:hypothetical protein
MNNQLSCDDEIFNLNSHFNISVHNVAFLSKIKRTRFAKTDIAFKTKNPSKISENDYYSKTRLLIRHNKPVIFQIKYLPAENVYKTKFACCCKLFIAVRFDTSQNLLTKTFLSNNK